jgi:hypothetical protein
VGVDVLSGRNGCEGFADRAPVSDYRFSGCDFSQGDFVTCGNRPLHPDFTGANYYGLPGRKGNTRDGDVVGGV